MAKKKPSFRELYGSWSAQEAQRERDSEDPRNRQARGEAILNELIAQGEDISDDQYGVMLGDFMNTGEMTLPGASTTPTAPILPTAADERPMPQMSAITSESMLDSLTTDPVQMVRDLGARFRAASRTGLAGLITGPADAANAAINSPTNVALASELGIVLPQVRNPKIILEEAARLRQEAAAIRRDETSARSKVGENVIADAEGLGVIGALARNPTILADQAAEQAGQFYASLPGGVVGPAGMVVAQGLGAAGQQGEDAYQTVLDKGGSEEEAQAARNVAAGVSFVANTAVPSLTPKGTALEELVTGAAERTASRSVARAAAAPLAGETVSEAFTEALDQGGLNVATGEPWSKGLTKAAALGAVLGAGMGAAPAAADARAVLTDRAERRAETEETILRNADRARSDAIEVERASEEPSLDRQLYEAEQDIQAAEAKRSSLEAAFTAREQEQATQKELEEEAGFRTIERDQNLPTSRVERYADVVERTPVNPPAEITAEQIAAEREQAAELAAQSKRVAEINKVASRRKTLEATAAKKAGDAEKKAQAAEASLRTRATDALIAEGLDDAAVADALPARISAMREEALAKKQAPAKKTAKPAAKKTAARKPATPKAVPDVAKLKASSNPLDRAQAEVLERLGMTKKRGEATPGDFEGKARKIARVLAGDASRRGAAVENLIRQGKVVVVPNAKSAGREDAGRVGEYDVDSGTTYVYTDNLSDNVHADIMEATAHETGHLGQFNERDQRPEMLKSLLGNKSTSEGAKKLRAAAASGNRFAQEALDAAEADTAARTEAGEKNPSRYEDAELVAYAIGAENRGRTTTLGQAGGALRDAVAGAKEQVRKRLGLDLDVSLGDLRSAMGRVLEEGVATDTTAADTGDTLGLIYPRTAAGFEQAKKDGRVYLSKNGQEQFVLTDRGSRIHDGAERDLLNVGSGEGFLLGDILDHPTLYENMPEAKNIVVAKSDGFKANNMGMYYPGQNLIEVNPKVLTGDMDANLREVLIHETQHWMQEQARGIAAFEDNKPTASEREAEITYRTTQLDNDDASAGVLFVADRLAEAVQGKDAFAAQLIREAANNDNLTEFRKANTIATIISDNNLELPAGLKRVYNKFVDTLADYRIAAVKFNAAKARQYKRYVNLHTEAEAFFAQRNVDTPQDQLPINPETGDPLFGTAEGADTRQMALGRETLGMAARRADGRTAFRNRNRFTTALTSAVRNDKGLGTHIRNEVELAKAAPVEFEAKANRAAGKYDDAVKALAKAKGKTPEAINAEIRGKLEEIADMEGSASDYQAAFNAIADQYGRAGAALKELRGLVDDLSTEFIRTYLDSGVKLTAKEKDDIRKVAANLGRYVHRFYASRLGRGLGNKYSQAVQNAVDQAQEKGKKSLTPKQKELYDRYANAAKTILDGVMIPDAEGMADLQDSHVDYLYDTWIGTDPTGVTREDKEAALLDIRDEVGESDLQQKVDAATQALLHGVRENAASRFYDRGEKLNTTIMQKRSHIPKEIRALMGEVTDPAGALVNTVSKQAEYVARTKMMLALRNMASSQDLQPPGSAGNAAVRANNMTELTGEGFGPLQGWYASPSMKAMIGDTAESLMNFTDAITTNSRNGEAVVEATARNAARVWMRGAAAAKAVNILGNAFRFPLNFAGSFAMLGANGNFNVKSYASGLQDATAIIRYAAKPSAGLGSAELASKYRVVDSATVGDLKNLDMGKIEQVVREMSGKNPGAFMRKARELGMAGRELYAMMDVWSKIANFHAEANFLKSLYKQEGLNKTDDEIYREASAIVNNTNMSYARTMPLVKAIERGGVTQYGPYLYEAHRVVLANAYQALHEIYSAKNFSDPAAAARMAGRGLTRLTGLSGTLAMIGALSHFFAGTFGDDEEEKRALLPEFARVMDFMKIGVDEDGKPILYAVSNIDPLGPITDLYRAARLGEQPLEAVWNQFKENYIAPSLGGAAYDAFARTTGIVEPATTRPRKPLMQQWLPNGWSAVTGATGGEDKWASIAHLLETRYVPGTMRAWSDSNPIAVGGTSDEVAYNIARGLGARGLRYDPKVGVQDAAFNYDDTMKTVRRDLAAYLETTTEPTVEELTKRLLSVRQDEKKAWDQLYTTRNGLYALDLEEDEIRALLKEARVPKEVISQLMDNEFSSRAISETSLNSAEASETRRAKTQAAKDKVAAKWETAREILGDLQGDE